MNVNDDHYHEHHSIKLSPFIAIQHVTQLQKFKNDKYLCPHGRVHIVFFSVNIAHSLAFMLFVLPNLLNPEP